MATFATITDLRDTAAFARKVEASDEPVQVMKGRERKMVVLSNEQFERYERMERQLAFEAKLREAEDDTRAGRLRPFENVQGGMRAKYGV